MTDINNVNTTVRTQSLSQQESTAGANDKLGTLAGRVVAFLDKTVSLPSSLKSLFPEHAAFRGKIESAPAEDAGKTLQSRSASVPTPGELALIQFKQSGQLSGEGLKAARETVVQQIEDVQKALNTLNEGADKVGGAKFLHNNRFDTSGLSPAFVKDIADHLASKSATLGAKSAQQGIQTVANKLEVGVRLTAKSAHESILSAVAQKIGPEGTKDEFLEAYRSEQTKAEHYNLNGVLKDFVFGHLPSTLSDEDRLVVEDHFVEERRLSDKFFSLQDLLGELNELDIADPIYASIDDDEQIGKFPVTDGYETDFESHIESNESVPPFPVDDGYEVADQNHDYKVLVDDLSDDDYELVMSADYSDLEAVYETIGARDYEVPV